MGKTSAQQFAATVVQKIEASILLLLTAVLLAALYGAVHNQISYTVSPEYFTKFKFNQFGILTDTPRLGAAWIGVLASWWMGIPIGLVLGATSWVFSGFRRTLSEALRSYVVVLVVTISVGLIGLLVATLHLSSDRMAVVEASWWIPDTVEDKAAFYRAGMMHNASYIGGVLGLAFGVVYQLYRRRKWRRASTDSSTRA